MVFGANPPSPVTLARVFPEWSSQDLYYTVTPGRADSAAYGRGRSSAFRSPQTTGIHYASSFSICPFIFRCLEMSGRACVLPLPWLCECVLMAVRRDRLCIVLGRVACQLSWTALAKVFLFPSGLRVPRVLQVQSVRSLAAASGQYTDKFRPKDRGSSPRRGFFTTPV